MTLVVLAIVLNTVIFTQNLATREAVDTRSPVEFTNAVDAGVEGAIVEANYWNATGYDALDAELRRSVSTWAGNATRFSASKGMAADATLLSTSNGTRVIQNTERVWTNESDETAWTMASGVSEIRRFHANISESSLEPADDTGLATSDAFRVEVDNGTDTWSLYVYENNSNVEVTAVSPGGAQTTCSTTNDQPTIDITDAAVNGTPCGFTFAENVSGPYDVTVEHGDNAQGRYTFVANQNRTTFDGNVGEHYSASPAPFFVHAVYSADVRVTVDRSDISYARNVTVAPEDAPVGERYDVN